MKRIFCIPGLPCLAAVLISLQLAGCTTTKEAVLSQDGPTMQAIYDRHMQTLQRAEQTPVRGTPLAHTGIAQYHGFVREAARELETRFPRLPNPTLVMYVYPHLSGPERTPVPGYVTTFPFYARIEYALPGEVRVIVPAALRQKGSPDEKQEETQ